MQAKHPEFCPGCGEKFHGFTSCDIDRMKANIAKQRKLEKAAPDLLAALKAIKKECPSDPDVTPEFFKAWQMLEAAIARAEEV